MSLQAHHLKTSHSSSEPDTSSQWPIMPWPPGPPSSGGVGRAQRPEQRAPQAHTLRSFHLHLCWLLASLRLTAVGSQGLLASCLRASSPVMGVLASLSLSQSPFVCLSLSFSSFSFFFILSFLLLTLVQMSPISLPLPPSAQPGLLPTWSSPHCCECLWATLMCICICYVFIMLYVYVICIVYMSFG